MKKQKNKGIDFHSWDKGDTKTRRRQNILYAMRGNHLKAGRELSKIASRTTDHEIRAKALDDASYFFVKYSAMKKR